MMQRASVITAGLLCTLLLSVPYSNDLAGQGAAAWTMLFDGKNLAAFDTVGDANWQVVDGVVQASKGNGFLVTKASFGDFEFKAEFWVDDDANSGVFIRCSNPREITAANSYEVNIFDKRPDQAYRTGGIVDVAKPASVINTGGKWNTYEITARGPRMIVTLNGTRLVDVQHNAHARGPIALQYGAGAVKFRNVQVRPL
jgi:hypothetical protein